MNRSRKPLAAAGALVAAGAVALGLSVPSGPDGDEPRGEPTAEASDAAEQVVVRDDLLAAHRDVAALWEDVDVSFSAAPDVSVSALPSVTVSLPGSVDLAPLAALVHGPDRDIDGLEVTSALGTTALRYDSPSETGGYGVASGVWAPRDGFEAAYEPAEAKGVAARFASDAYSAAAGFDVAAHVIDVIPQRTSLPDEDGNVRDADLGAIVTVAPAVAVPGTDGGTVPLTQFKGQVVVANGHVARFALPMALPAASRDTVDIRSGEDAIAAAIADGKVGLSSSAPTSTSFVVQDARLFGVLGLDRTSVSWWWALTDGTSGTASTVWVPADEDWDVADAVATGDAPASPYDNPPDPGGGPGRTENKPGEEVSS